MFICPSCRKTFNDPLVWKCTCGSVLNLDFSPQFSKTIQSTDLDHLLSKALPFVQKHELIDLGQNNTPLLPIDFNGRIVRIKQDHLMPSGSFKDRGAGLLISFFKKHNITHIVEDSSGNAGAAIAAFCAQAGMACDIYVPATTSPGKLKQIEAYGARLVKIHGSRQDTADAVLQAAKKTAYASHVYNPFFFHGTKFFAYEIFMQMKQQAPDTVILPAGNGTILLGAFIGFSELLNAGLILRLPKLVAVQAANCAPLYAKFHRQAEVKTMPTSAEGIAIAEPARAQQMLEAVQQSTGTFLKVTEKEISAAWKEMASRGFYIEPTSAAAIAGVQQYLQQANPEETIISTFTGHGLKK